MGRGEGMWSDIGVDGQGIRVLSDCESLDLVPEIKGETLLRTNEENQFVSTVKHFGFVIARSR
jgi:hypothetical protein